MKYRGVESLYRQNDSLYAIVKKNRHLAEVYEGLIVATSGEDRYILNLSNLEIDAIYEKSKSGSTFRTVLLGLGIFLVVFPPIAILINGGI